MMVNYFMIFLIAVIVGLLAFPGCRNWGGEQWDKYVMRRDPNINKTSEQIPQNFNQPNLPPDNSIKIASWNLQRFGPSKSTNTTIMNQITGIINNYDLVIIQEITDSSGEAYSTLLADLPAFKGVISNRIGRTSYKEQYAFLYKPTSVSYISSFQMPDNGDVFEREPFVGRFKNNKNNEEFSVIQVHIKPDDAMNEISALDFVADYTINYYNDSEVVIAGDFNADCTYFFHTNQLPDFEWIVSDYTDTTYSPNTNCAYDRILLKDLTANSWGIEKNFSAGVSDHYLVWAEIK